MDTVKRQHLTLLVKYAVAGAGTTTLTFDWLGNNLSSVHGMAVILFPHFLYSKLLIMKVAPKNPIADHTNLERVGCAGQD